MPSRDETILHEFQRKLQDVEGYWNSSDVTDVGATADAQASLTAFSAGLDNLNSGAGVDLAKINYPFAVSGAGFILAPGMTIPVGAKVFVSVAPTADPGASVTVTDSQGNVYAQLGTPEGVLGANFARYGFEGTITTALVADNGDTITQTNTNSRSAHIFAIVATA